MSCCSKTVSLDFLYQCLCMDMTWAYRNPVWKPTYLLDTHAHVLLQGFLFMEKLVPLCVSLTFFEKVQRSSAGSCDCQTKCDSGSLLAKCCENWTFTLTPHGRRNHCMWVGQDPPTFEDQRYWTHPLLPSPIQWICLHFSEHHQSNPFHMTEALID